MADVQTTISTLQSWAADAATVNTNWPGMTAAQKDAATRETIRRLGLMASFMANTLGHYAAADF